MQGNGISICSDWDEAKQWEQTRIASLYFIWREMDYIKYKKDNKPTINQDSYELFLL